MVQIYLLSVIGCFFGGVLLLADSTKEKIPSLSLFKDWYLNNQSYQPFIFCLFILVGILTFIFPYKGIPVLGDFIPALVNITTGIALFLAYYKTRGTVISETFKKTINFFENYESAIAVIAFISCLTHFILPGVIFL